MGVLVAIIVWVVMIFFLLAFFYGIGENKVVPP